MKKLIQIILAALLVGVVVGCDEYNEVEPEKVDAIESRITFSQGGSIHYKSVAIEGCEYFACYSHNARYILTHKGNCTNAIHQLTKN